MRVKRSFAMLTVLAMLFSLMGAMSVSAANAGLVGSEKAKLELIYMQYKDGVSDANVEEVGGGNDMQCAPAAIPKDLKIGDKFLLGIKLSGLPNITEAKDGVYNMSVAFVYDDTYIDIESAGDFTYFAPYRIGKPSGSMFYRNKYTYKTTAMGNNPNPDGAGKVQSAYLQYGQASGNPSYTGAVDQYLAVIACTIKAVPANGAKVFSFSENNAVFTASFGETGNSASYAAGDTGVRDILPLFDLDVSAADIFPMPKTPVSATVASGAPAVNNLTVGGKIAGLTNNVKLNVKYNDDTTSTEGAYKFYYGAAGKTTKAESDGLTEITKDTALVKATHNGQTLYASYLEGGVEVLATIGEMTVKAAKTVASVSVTGAISDFTYGGKVATTGLQPKVQYTEPADWPEEPIATGGKWLIVKPDGSSADLNANTVYPAGNGYKVRLTYSGKSADTAAFNITKKALSVPASVGNAKAVTAGATGDDLKVNGTYTFETADGLVGSDVVTATWSGAYANANAAGSVEVDVTLAATLDGAAKDNYTFAGGASKANGTVSDDPLKTIAVTAPTGSFTTDTGIDLTTLKAKGTKNSGAVDFDAANFDAIIAAGCEVLVDGVKTETAQVAVTTEGSHTIKVTKGGVEGTATVTVGAGATVAPVEKPVVGDITNASAKVTNAPADANTVKYAIVEVTDEENIVAPAADAYTAGKVAFDELKKDTKYVIFAIALGNGTTVVDSEPVHSDVFKTFKNKITILDKNEDEMSVGYADDIAELTEDKLHEIVEEPSRLDGYYTDVAFENVVEFPIALTDDLTLYAKIKKSSGGGGGGGGWNTSTTKPALSLNQKALSGHVGETATLRATLTDSTAKITWESDNEAVATVDENGVVTFVAVGTANITATAGSLKETAEVTVVADDVVVPTEESLINEKYTGPYVYGYEDGTFGAAREITRAEVVAMVSRLLKNPIDENKNYDTNFTDVADGTWYKNYIGFLAQYNIVEGYGDGTFAPANKITRAEMTAILARAAKFQLTGDATTFSDVENSFWAKAYIATMAEKNLVNGYPDGTFAPNKNITRAETVTILNRMLDDSTVSGSIIPADVDSSYWAYNDIVKAMNDRVLD